MRIFERWRIGDLWKALPSKIAKRKSKITLVLLVGALSGAGGCGDAATPYREIIRARAAAFRNLESTLSAVTDQASLAAAETEAKKSVAELKAVQDRATTLAKPTLAITERVAQDAAELKRAFEGVIGQMGRIQILPGGENFLRNLDRGQGILRAAP
jgi:hypothetical protein